MTMKVFLLCVALALPASLLSQAAVAENVSSFLQEDVVEEVNASRQTLVMAGETFQVDRNANLEDAEGRPISIQEIRGTQNDGEGDFVEYALVAGGESRTGSGLRSIASLRVLGGDFE